MANGTFIINEALNSESAAESALPLLCNRGRRFIAGEGFEPTTYQIFVSGSAWPTIDKS